MALLMSDDTCLMHTVNEKVLTPVASSQTPDESDVDVEL